MFVVVDTETEGLKNPQKLWLVVCTEVETEKVHVFRNLHDPANHQDLQRFRTFSKTVSGWIGHNIIGFDWAVLDRLTGVTIPRDQVMDTLVISRLLNAGVQGGHSLEAIGERLGFHKISFSDFSQYSKEMEEYCIRDTLVTLKFYKSIEKYLYSSQWKDSLRLEHEIAFICEEMKTNGFFFNFKEAQGLYQEISLKVETLSNILSSSFLPKSSLVREIKPKATKHGTISKVDFRWTDDLTPYQVDCPFSLIEWVPFNPGSPKQVVERLNEAGWSPYEKTKGHITAERECDHEKLAHYAIYGWKVSEENLKTLPNLDYLNTWINYCHIKIPKHALNIKELITKGILKESELQQEKLTIETQKLLGTDSLKESMVLVSKTLQKCLISNTDAVQFVENTHDSWLIIVTPQDAYVDCSAIIATPTWAGLKNTPSQQSAISTNEAARKLVEWLTLNNRKTVLETWFKAITVHGANSESKSKLQSAVQSMGGFHTEALSTPSSTIPRTISESLDQCVDDALREGSLSCRIHGTFTPIGAWTHRMSHSNPNMANIPAGDNLYAHEMRALWGVPKGKLLVGVDADGIQLRVLAHYMNDPEFTKALVAGRKEDGSDAHSMNMRALGPVCKDRDTAKTFIYAFLLGAGISKVAQILGCKNNEAKEAVSSFLNRITGLKYLKEEVIPRDAARGYFQGLDGRLVMCDSEHLMLAGYLQNGESVIMKRASLLWRKQLRESEFIMEKLKGDLSSIKLVNFVHDEWQLEVPDDLELATRIAEIQADAIRQVGEDLKLNCPMAGSIMNQHKQLAIGANWSITH